jgi:hypothetical protein
MPMPLAFPGLLLTEDSSLETDSQVFFTRLKDAYSKYWNGTRNYGLETAQFDYRR